jgi:hypothetical protein
VISVQLLRRLLPKTNNNECVPQWLSLRDPLLLVMVFQISVAMAVGLVLGWIWQIRCDLEETGNFIPPG